MKRKVFIMIISMLLATCAAVGSLTATASGAETGAAKYFYVDPIKGSDVGNDGTVSRPLKTLAKAYAFAEASGCTDAVIVIMGRYTQSTAFSAPKHGFSVTVTSNDGKTDYGKVGAKLVFGSNLRYYLGGSTTFEHITVEYGGTLNFVCEHNPVTFGDGFATKCLTSAASGVYVVGGFQAPTDQVPTGLDTHITIKSGDFKVIVGGSRDKADGSSGSKYKINTFTGTHYIEISGGTVLCSAPLPFPSTATLPL